MDSENGANVAAAKRASYANSADAADMQQIVELSSSHRMSGSVPCLADKRATTLARDVATGDPLRPFAGGQIDSCLEGTFCHSRRAKLKEEPSSETGDLINFGKKNVVFEPQVPLSLPRNSGGMRPRFSEGPDG